MMMMNISSKNYDLVKLNAFIEDNITYIVLSDDTLGVLELVNPYVSELVIPETVHNMTVTEILPKAFYFNSSLTKVTLPNSIKTVGIYAFYFCSNITDIEDTF